MSSIIAEVNRDKKKRSKPFTPNDFMPRKKVKMTDKQMTKSLELATVMLGGEIK